MTKSLKVISGIVLTGVWECEGHTVMFTESDKNKSEMKITESMRGNTWNTIGRNWSMTKKVSITEAIEEQDKLIKFGYQKMN
tara:strand:+ start:67 stop:312 length:246 start_codon:yes stop_codon:yes gene_type:complete